MNKKAPAVIKRDSAENWAKAKNYRPDLGTIIVYDYDDGSCGLKIADGNTLVNDLPFLNSNKKTVVEGTTLKM